MARTVRPTANPPASNIVKLPEPPKRPRDFWRRLRALVGMRAPRRAQHRGNPFAPAQPPPGVVGDGSPKIPKIAMDHAERWKLAMDQEPAMTDYGWMGQMGGYFASAHEEGMVWLGYAYLALLSQRAEYRVMTETYAKDMTREWIKVKSKSEDHDKQSKIDELVKRLEELRLKHVVKAAIEHDGFQGRGQIYIDTGDEDDPEELRTPIGSGGKDSQAKFGHDSSILDEPTRSRVPRTPSEPTGPRVPSRRSEPKTARVPFPASDQAARRKKIKRLAAIEPMWTYPAQYNANDPLKPDWYRPDTWWVMGKEVHRTRLLTFVSNPVADMLKPAYSFGGLSKTQMAKPYVDLYLRNRTSASDLLNNFSIPVLATDLDVTAMDEGSELFHRVETFNIMRDNQSTMVINKGTEEFNIAAAPLGGIKDLVGQSQEHMTTPCQIPIVKFFGNQPSGLNADSEGVIRLWYDNIRAEQESLLREPIQTIINLVMIELWGDVDDDIEFEFIELWQLDEAGKSAIQQTKANQRAIDIEAGIIIPEEGRVAVARDPDSQYAGLDLHEPLPEPDPMELLGPEGMRPEGETGPAAERGMVKGAPGIKPSHRGLGQRITGQAAAFGSPATGGFGKG